MDAQQETGEGEKDTLIEEHLSAGRVIRVDEMLHQLWRRRFGEEEAEGRMLTWMIQANCLLPTTPSHLSHQNLTGESLTGLSVKVLAINHLID